MKTHHNIWGKSKLIVTKKPKSKNSKAYSRLNLNYVQLAKFIIFLSNVLGWSESCIFGIGIYHWSFGCWVLTYYFYTFWLVGMICEWNNSFISQVLHYSSIFKGHLDCIILKPIVACVLAANAAAISLHPAEHSQD